MARALSTWALASVILWLVGCVNPTHGDALLVRRSTRISYMNLSNYEFTPIPAQSVSDLPYFSPIDYDPTDQMIYWVSGRERATVRRMTLNGTRTESIPIRNIGPDSGIGRKRFSSLKLDVEGRRLYWAKRSLGGVQSIIESAFLNGSDGRIIINRNLLSTRSVRLDLDPMNRMLYWANCYAGKIERAMTNGSSRETLVNAECPWSLTLDLKNEDLYWTDNDQGVIARSKLDGTERQVVQSNVSDPRDLVLLGEHLYWTSSKGLERAGVSPHSEKELLVPTLGQISTLKVTRLANGTNVAFARIGSELPIFNLNQTHNISSTIKIVNHGLQAIDYNPDDNRIYWTDSTNNAIRSANIDGSGQVLLAGSNIEIPRGLAVSSKTSSVFWTDSGRDVIERVDFDSSGRRLIVSTNLSNPYAIAVDDSNSMVYWTDYGTDRIERASFTGTSRQILVNSFQSGPYGLALDVEHNKMYWNDASWRKIEVSDLNGQSRQLVRQGEVRSITFHDNHIYWSYRYTIQKLDVRNNQADDEIVVDTNTIDALAVIETDECASSPCTNEATCHDGINSFQCLCPLGFTGVHCETGIQECSSNPCANGATCYDDIDKYSCHCEDGYTGILCQTDIDDCLPTICANGATCHDAINDYNCECAAGFTGNDCETDIDECELSTNTCPTDPAIGSCQNTEGDYLCLCEEGYRTTDDQHGCQGQPITAAGTVPRDQKLSPLLWPLIILALIVVLLVVLLVLHIHNKIHFGKREKRSGADGSSAHTEAVTEMGHVNAGTTRDDGTAVAGANSAPNRTPGKEPRYMKFPKGKPHKGDKPEDIYENSDVDFQTDNAKESGKDFDVTNAPLYEVSQERDLPNPDSMMYEALN